MGNTFTFKASHEMHGTSLDVKRSHEVKGKYLYVKSITRNA